MGLIWLILSTVLSNASHALNTILQLTSCTRFVQSFTKSWSIVSARIEDTKTDFYLGI